MLHVHVLLDQGQRACYTFTCRWIRNNVHATRSRVVGLGTTCMLHVHVLLDQEQHACYTFTCCWIRNNYTIYYLYLLFTYDLLLDISAGNLSFTQMTLQHNHDVQCIIATEGYCDSNCTMQKVGRDSLTDCGDKEDAARPTDACCLLTDSQRQASLQPGT